MLYLTEDISISGLQVPFCFFSSNHCLFALGIHPLNRAPPKIQEQPLEFHKYLVPVRSYLYFRFTSAILFFYGDHYLSVSDIRPIDWAPRKMQIQPLEFHKYVISIRRYFYFRSTSAILFSPVFIVYLCRVKSDIKKSCQQHIQVRCP